MGTLAGGALADICCINLAPSTVFFEFSMRMRRVLAVPVFLSVVRERVARYPVQYCRTVQQGSLPSTVGRLDPYSPGIQVFFDESDRTSTEFLSPVGYMSVVQ